MFPIAKDGPIPQNSVIVLKLNGFVLLIIKIKDAVEGFLLHRSTVGHGAIKRHWHKRNASNALLQNEKSRWRL